MSHVPTVAHDHHSRTFDPLLSAVADGLWVADAELRLLAVDDNFAALVGEDADALIGRSLSDLVAAQQRGQLAERLAQAAGCGDRVAVHLCGPRNTQRAVEIALQWVDSGGIRQLRGACKRPAVHASRPSIGMPRLGDFEPSALDYFWETDAAHRFTYFNVGGKTPAMTTASSALGRTRWDFAGADPADPKWAQHIADLGARRVIEEFQYYRVDGDGQRRTYCVNGAPVFSAAGEFMGYRGVTRDVTKVSRARAALTQREGELTALANQQQAILDALPANVALLGRDGTIEHVNANWRAFGAANGLAWPDHGVGRNYLQVCRNAAEREDSHARAVAQSLERLLDGAISHFVYEYPCPDPVNKRSRWFQLVAAPVTAPGHRRAVVMHIDITERKLAMQALADSERRLRQITDAVPVPITVTRPRDGRVLFANKALGACYPCCGGVGADDRHCFCPTPGSRREILEALELAGGRIDDFELQYTRCDGKTFVASITAQTTQFAGEEAVIAAIVDISQRREMEQALKAREQELRQMFKMEALGTFASGIAHDFNNLLQPILLLGQSALDDLPVDSPARENLTTILTVTERAGELVNKILAFSRAESEGAATADLAQLLRDNIAFMWEMMPSSVHLATDIPESVGVVGIAATEVQQILLNLVANARDATDGAGRVRIAVERIRVDGFIGPRQERLPPGDYAQLTVSDTGSGMDETTRDRAFDPFFTTKPVGQGTGMGLAVVHGIVSKAGGTILLDSAPGEGTTVDILLPVQAADAGGRMAASPKQCEELET